MSKRRVVVTGLGMLSPVGNTVESTWKALLAGQSGISLIDHFDTSAYATKFAGLVKDFNCDDIISRKEQRKMDAFIQYGIVAGVQAMQDSGLEVTEENAARIGAAIGSGIGGLGLIEENHSSLVNGGPRKISPFFVPSTIVNMVAGHLTIMFGLRGPSISIATACGFRRAQHRPGRAHHRLWRCRCDGGRRRGKSQHPAWRGRLRRGACALHAQ